MMVIHGLGTVNCGEVKEFKGKDLFDRNWKLSNNSDLHVVLEILRPEKHNPGFEIVCYYYWDKEIEAKVEVTIYRDIKTRKMGSEVYYFKGAKESQHYRSRNYPNFIGMPKKHYDIVKWIYPYFLETFGFISSNVPKMTNMFEHCNADPIELSIFKS